MWRGAVVERHAISPVCGCVQMTVSSSSSSGNLDVTKACDHNLVADGAVAQSRVDGLHVVPRHGVEVDAPGPRGDACPRRRTSNCR